MSFFCLLLDKGDRAPVGGNLARSRRGWGSGGRGLTACGRGHDEFASGGFVGGEAAEKGIRAAR